MTHDQQEALTLSDRIAIRENGSVSKCSGPNDIYRSPANRFVAEFIGRINLVKGRIERRDHVLICTAEGGVTFVVPQHVLPAVDSQREFSFVLRPESVQLDPRGEMRDDGIRADGTILQVIYSGAVTSYIVEIGTGLRLRAEEQNTLGKPRYRENDHVVVYVDPAAISSVLAE